MLLKAWWWMIVSIFMISGVVRLVEPEVDYWLGVVLTMMLFVAMLAAAKCVEAFRER